MSALTTKREWFEKLASYSDQLPVDKRSSWLTSARQNARQRLQRMDPPHRKQENWRYTSIEPLISRDFYFSARVIQALQDSDIENWILDSQDSYRLVFANGVFIPQLSNIEKIADSVKIGSLKEALVNHTDITSVYLTQNIDVEYSDVFTTLNEAYLNDGLFIHVPRNVTINKPVEIQHINLKIDNSPLIIPRHLVILESGAKASLVERYCSTGNSVYFNNQVSDVFVNDNASLDHYYIQDESVRAHHHARINLRLGSASEYRGKLFSLGSVWSRCYVDAKFTGQDAYCNLSGIYAVNDRQLADVHLNIEHNYPRCTSRENFRGIAGGKGRAVFDGKITVAKLAQKSDAALTNKNLLLSKHAEVDTKPQLEIYADDVKCSHGTTVGQIDPQQYFYMKSRGIDDQTAKKLLCLGFAGEILDEIKLDEVKQFIETRIANNIGDIVQTGNKDEQ